MMMSMLMLMTMMLMMMMMMVMIMMVVMVMLMAMAMVTVMIVMVVEVIGGAKDKAYLRTQGSIVSRAWQGNFVRDQSMGFAWKTKYPEDAFWA